MSKDDKKPLRITVHKRVIAISETGEQVYMKGIDFEALLARKAALKAQLGDWPSVDGGKFIATEKKTSFGAFGDQNRKPQVNTDKEAIKSFKSPIEQRPCPEAAPKRKRQSDEETVVAEKKKIKYLIPKLEKTKKSNRMDMESDSRMM